MKNTPKEVTVTEQDEQELKSRADFEECIVQMFMDRVSDHNFYANIISNCKVSITTSIGTLGVYFKNGVYHLDINPDFFNKLSKDERIAVLKHEMLHILYKHLTVRSDFENHEQANVAMDMAINQVIPNLPDGAVDYRDYKDFPDNCNTEQYYDLLKNDEKFQDYLEQKEAFKEALKDALKDALENGDTDTDGNPLDEEGNPINIPSKMHAEHNWELTPEEKEMIDNVTKDILDNAVEKTRGNLPQDISDIMNLFNTEVQVNWKQALKNMVGNKKANYRSTIKRRNRRQPHRMDLNGRTKDTTFELICLLDVSGSMSDKEILVPLNEVKEICKMTNTGMKVVQIDTEVKEVSNFDKNTKSFTRSGCGGTYMYDGIKYLLENKIHFDGIVFISDLYIEDIGTWEVMPKVPIFWLTETPGDEGSQVQDYPRQKRFLIDTNK